MTTSDRLKQRKTLKQAKRFWLLAIIWVGVQACRTVQPIPAVSEVDLNRFMGDWYVIAHIPTMIEKTAYNAVESYRLSDDRKVATTFTFNEGALDGPLKVYKVKGFIQEDPSNAVWGMQFVWPFKAEYRIIYLDDAYSLTVIGRSKRDYLWIMAREPSISETEYRRVLAIAEKQGYDVNQVRKVPHRGG
jgi:apolipoprotein D and lipocalin family protein